MAHTHIPGPWSVDHREILGWSGQYPVIVNKDGLAIAVVREQDPAEVEVANAHLLAAAPEMLAALAAWSEWMTNRDVPFEISSATRLALTKATKG